MLIDCRISNGWTFDYSMKFNGACMSAFGTSQFALQALIPIRSKSDVWIDAHPYTCSIIFITPLHEESGCKVCNIDIETT